jgi:hypothetical protein
LDCIVGKVGKVGKVEEEKKIEEQQILYQYTNTNERGERKRKSDMQKSDMQRHKNLLIRYISKDQVPNPCNPIKPEWKTTGKNFKLITHK